MKSTPATPARDITPRVTPTAAPTDTPLQRDETCPGAELEVIECPLHTAMRQIAEAAVTQHVLYTEGVYRPREGLAHEMQVWLRLHELVWEYVCPATRTGSTPRSRDLEIALAGLPVEMRAKVATAIRACGRRSRGEGCPLESEPVEQLVE